MCCVQIRPILTLNFNGVLMCSSTLSPYAQIQMLGYDISWAGFNIIEVMSSSKFTHKRIGYLAASQCFHADSEVGFITKSVPITPIVLDVNRLNEILFNCSF